jgi:DNA-directed RNA polymerase specialized sigma24 family protein
LFQLRFAADPATFGNIAYGVFHILEVQGLPRTAFVPKTIREIDRLPREYGREFGNRALGVARKYLHNDDDVEEVLSLVALKLVSNESLKKSIKGKNIREAENYTLRAVQNQAVDYLRGQKVRRYEEINDLISEPESWDGLGDLIPKREQEQIKNELESGGNKDISMYLELLLDGYSNKEIAEKKMLPFLKLRPISQQALAKKYRNKLKNVLMTHFEVQSAGQAKP